MTTLRGNRWRFICAVVGHRERYVRWYRGGHRFYVRRVDCERCRAFVAESVHGAAAAPLDINPPPLRRSLW